MQLNPTLFFTGNAEEALAFYRDALGGKIDLNRYKDAPPDQGSSPDWADKIMYGTITSPYGVIAAMDAPPERAGQSGDNFGISVTADSDADASSIFTKLSNGGHVLMPFGETFFAAKFGMAKDKFGTTWLISYQLIPVAAS